MKPKKSTLYSFGISVFFALPSSPILASNQISESCETVWNANNRDYWNAENWQAQSCPQDDFFFLKLGEVYLAQKNYDLGMQSAKQGLSLLGKYKNQIKLLMLDLVQFRNERFNNGDLQQEILNKYIAYYENVETNVHVLETIIALAFKMRDYDTVLRYSSTVLNEKPTVETYNLTIASLMAQHKFEQANLHLTKAYNYSENVLTNPTFVKNGLAISETLGDTESVEFYRIMAKKIGI